MNLGPRAALVEALFARHMAAHYGVCACGVPRAPRIVCHDGEVVTVFRCDRCGRRGRLAA